MTATSIKDFADFEVYMFTLYSRMFVRLYGGTVNIYMDMTWNEQSCNKV